MKKQVVILVSFLGIVVGFFVVTNNSGANSTTLFEPQTELGDASVDVDENEADYLADADEAVDQINQDAQVTGTVFVDVQGEVVSPGVFEVDYGARVGYLIYLAGGLTDYANVRNLNQAARIYDEMVIRVAHVDDVMELSEADVVSGNGSANETATSGLISLSTASATELQSLPGIGPAISANIIAHRDTFGAFSTIDELTNVAGIGAGIVENIRELVSP